MKTETIITPRLILRRLRPEDALPLHENCSSDEKVVRYLERSACADPQITKALVSGWIERYESEDFFLWAIEFEGEVIGTVNLHDIDRKEASCEIGYSIGSRWWNRGIMTEAAGAVVRSALNELGFERITGWCAAENAASARVMEKIGMKRVGVLPPFSQLCQFPFRDLSNPTAYSDKSWVYTIYQRVKRRKFTDERRQESQKTAYILLSDRHGGHDAAQCVRLPGDDEPQRDGSRL